MRLRRADVTWRELEGRTVILDLAESRYLATNRTGALLLRVLLDECSHDRLVSVLSEEYDVPRDQADADVRAFTDLLREHGLLVDDDTHGA